ncbi:MAG TPA: hypothetical protein VE978_06445 [Chitinophagales bacterium]|nr:hypothetical protein [Chitinophagales bacterium]
MPDAILDQYFISKHQCIHPGFCFKDGRYWKTLGWGSKGDGGFFNIDLVWLKNNSIRDTRSTIHDTRNTSSPDLIGIHDTLT